MTTRLKKSSEHRIDATQNEVVERRRIRDDDAHERGRILFEHRLVSLIVGLRSRFGSLRTPVAAKSLIFIASPAGGYRAKCGACTT